MKSILLLLLTFLSLNVCAQEQDDVFNLPGLDVHPQFPGSFQNEVVKHMAIPEIENNDIDVKMYLTFIIEKDGSMSDIKCQRDPGYGLCMAAENALKAITTKWSPGIHDGVAVRVKYTLPMIIKIKSDPTPPKKDND